MTLASCWTQCSGATAAVRSPPLLLQRPASGVATVQGSRARDVRRGPASRAGRVLPSCQGRGTRMLEAARAASSMSSAAATGRNFNLKMGTEPGPGDSDSR
jgi:hypothetical protein